MKKLIKLLLFFFFSWNAYSQAPQGFNYQAIIRDYDGNIKANTGVQFVFEIQDFNGSSFYSELHTTITNKYGLTNLVIGEGVSNDDFSDIKWGSGTYMLNVTLDGVDLGATQLMSVPYALYALNSGSSSGGGGGVGISSTVDNGDGTFTLNYTDGTSFTTSNLSGKSAYQLWIDQGNTGTLKYFLESLDPVTLENTKYLSLNGQEIVGRTVPIIAGGTGAVNAGAARTNLGVDVAGTDNSTNVTLGGSSNYLTISGQQIIRGKVDLTNAVTGTLPISQGGTSAVTAEDARTALGLNGIETNVTTDLSTTTSSTTLTVASSDGNNAVLPVATTSSGGVMSAALFDAVAANIAKTGITSAQASAITANTAKETNVTTDLSTTTSSTTLTVASSDGNNAVLPVATTSSGGVMSAALFDAVAANIAKTGITSAQASAITANTAKETNVTTDLSTTTSSTTLTVASSDGNNAVLPVATTSSGGVMSAGLFDAVAANIAKTGITSAQASAITANTAKETNVTTDLSTTTSSTTLTVASSDGNNAVLPVATTSSGGVMSAALFDAVAANIAKTGITSAQASAITANTAKETNVTTDLSTTTSSTTLTVASSDGNNAVLPVATTSSGGVMSAGLFDAVAANIAKTGITSAQASAITANTAKETNVTTDLSTTTSSTTLTVASSDGNNAVLPVATTSSGGVMSAALFDAVAANIAKTGITSAQASAITANTAKETNVTTDLSTTTSSTTLTVASSDGNNAVLPVATTSSGGVMSAGLFDAVAANIAKTGITSAQASAITANTAKETNVTTDLSTTTSSTTLTVASSDGNNAVLPVATTSSGGVMSAALFDAVAANIAKTGITSAQASAITANTAKETNVTTDLSTTTSSTTLTVASSDGNNAVLPVATTSSGGVMSAALFDEVAANTAKGTNVSTNLSTSTSSTTLTVASSDGNNAVLPVATTSSGGVMSAALFDEVAANTAKGTNVSTNLSPSTSSTTLTVASSDGTDAVLPVATTSAGGVMSAAIFDVVTANTAKTGITSAQATTIANLGTISTQDANAVNIDGGAIDGVTIGTNGVVTQAVIDNINIDGATIGHTGDTDLLTLASGIVTVAGEVSLTTLDIGGTNVTADAGELNIMDGSATQATVTLAGTDGIVISDGNVMKQALISDIKTYVQTNTSINDLSDGKANDTNFSNSILIGQSTTGTLDNAQYNVGLGYGVFDALTSGDRNMGLGYNALNRLTEGSGNISIGGQSLTALTTGNRNVAIGRQSGRDVDDGQLSGGADLTTGEENTYIGAWTQPSASNVSNETVIGSETTGKGTNTVVIGNPNVTQVYAAQDGEATIYASALTRAASSSGDDLSVSLTGAVDASILISSAGTGSDAISIDATAGSMVIAPTLADGKSLKLGKNGAVEAIFSPHGTPANEKFSLINTSGTAADAIAFTSTAGGITVQVADEKDLTLGNAAGDAYFRVAASATASNEDVRIVNTNGTADAAIALTSIAGGVDVDAAAAKDINIAGGQVVLVSKDNAASAISLTTNVGANETIVVTNTQGTSDGSDDAGSIKLSAAAGGIGLAWADSKDLWAEGGRTVITANENAADAIKLHADVGANQTITLLNDAGTADAAIALTSTAGGITLASSAGLSVTGDTHTFSSANTTDPLFIIKNTTNDANSSRLQFVKDKGAAGANNDVAGLIQFYADDDGENSENFAQISAQISSAADNAEGGKLSLSVASHDGEMNDGLVLTDGNAEDEIDVTIGSGTSSVTTTAGSLSVGSSFTIPAAAGTAGKVLRWPSSGTTLEWASTPAPVYSLGTNYDELGGWVVAVNSSGTHGLVISGKVLGTVTLDIDPTHNYSFIVNNAREIISNPDNYTTAGAKFYDWRMPTYHEMANIIGPLWFNSSYSSFYKLAALDYAYWTSKPGNGTSTWSLVDFDGSGSLYLGLGNGTQSVIAVRAF